MKPVQQKILYTLLFIALFSIFFAGGGLIVTVAEMHVQPDFQTEIFLGSVVIVSLAAILFSSRALLKNGFPDFIDAASRRKHLLFSIIMFVVLVASTLAMLNFAASFYAVSWPMSGLHGVSPEVGKSAWGYRANSEGFVAVNSWGQRDRDRTVAPKPGVYRTIVVGDSFLEDGAATPLPARVEELVAKMGGSSHEFINLGVSATDPDEYYYRIKNVGLRLKPDHCVLMFSAGSDFIQKPSLLSFGGVSATYPRGSFLRILGLKSLDQVISNERRPILRAWFKGGALLKHELELQQLFGKCSTDMETESAFLSFFPEEKRAILKSVLYSSPLHGRGGFYEILRRPDDAKFRSYYLDIASKVALGQPAPGFIPAEYSYLWVKAAFELCRSRGVKFTLVVIPDGFTVDSRMSAQWAPLADMKRYMQYKDDATDRLVSHATADGMDLVDLRELLKKAPGAYLNMDGHWSQYGVDVVAAHLAQKISLNERSKGRKE